MFSKTKIKPFTKNLYDDMPNGYQETINKGMSAVRYFSRNMSYGKGRAKESEESMAQKGKKPLPDDETDTVADIFRRMDEIKEEIKAEVMESVKINKM